MPPAASSASGTETVLNFADVRSTGAPYKAFSGFVWDSRNLVGGVKRKDDDKLIGENPDQSITHYQANKEIFWQTFMDYAINHPEILSGFMSEFLQGANADIFGVFPIKITKEAVFYKTEIHIEPQLPSTSTRKVPGRNIHFKTNMRKGTAEYTGQGFSNDYHFLRTPDGMQWFDRMANAVISDIWLMIIHSALKEFQSVPSAYNQPDQLYPHDEVPLTVEALFDYEQTMFCPLNKGPQAIHPLIARVSRIFERKNDRVRKVLTTMDTLHFINVRDESNLDYQKSGSQAITNRTLGNSITTLHGVEVIPVQMLEPTLHSDVHDNVLRNVVVNGGMTMFPQKYLELDPKDYRSVLRDIKFSSWTLDKVETHPFVDFLNHCFEFYPLNSDNCRESEVGWLNYPLLYSLADAALGKSQSNVRNPFDTTKTIQQGNESKLHQFLDYVSAGTESPNRQWKFTEAGYEPIYFFGQIDECHMKQRYFDFTIKTLEHQLSSCLLPSEKSKIENFYKSAQSSRIDVERELRSNNPEIALLNAVAEKLINKASQICKDNYYATLLTTLKNPLDIAMDNFNAEIVATTNPVNRNDLIIKIFDSEENYIKNREHVREHGRIGLNDSSAVFKAYDKYLDEIETKYGSSVRDMQECRDNAKHSISGMNWMIKTLIKGNSTEKFVEQMAIMLAYNQFITLRGIQSWIENDVAIPLGGRIFRPFETQFAESMPMLADGEIGNTFFSGLDNTIQFDQSTQHFQTQVFTYFKVWIDKRDKFYMAPYVRGLQILGGKGNKYINNDPHHGGVVPVGSAVWNEMMSDAFGDMYASVGEKLKDYSMIPVLQSLNEAVEDDFRKRHLDIRGYWDPEDYVTRLHNSESFLAHRRAQPMYDNQFLINHIFPQFTTARIQPLDRQIASFDDVANHRRMNFAVHQTTQFYVNEKTMEWEETHSSHMWGRELDGIVGIQSSASAVGTY
jgi:hypothetical protein